MTFDALQIMILHYNNCLIIKYPFSFSLNLVNIIHLKYIIVLLYRKEYDIFSKSIMSKCARAKGINFIEPHGVQFTISICAEIMIRHIIQCFQQNVYFLYILKNKFLDSEERNSNLLWRNYHGLCMV